MFSNLLFIPDPSTLWNDSYKIAFKIGSLEVAWYGIFIMIGFIASITLAIVKLRYWYKVPIDPFYYFCLMGIPTAILGARIWSCCIGDASWSNFFNFKTGGLAIEGGVVLTILLALWWFPYKKKKPKYCIRDTLTSDTPVVRQVSMWTYADAIIPCILIGQVIGRWGNYFNQELYGSQISADNIGYIEFLAKHLPFMYIVDKGYYAHPLFLYESSINLVGLIILYVGLEFIPAINSGTISSSYILWYGIVRIILEPLRDNKYSFASTYIMTGLWIAVGITLIILNQLNIISKTRKYNCKFAIIKTIKHWFKICINKIVLFSLKKYETIKPQNQEQQQKQAKLKFYKEKQINENKEFELLKKQFVRKPENYLYYLGR